MDPTKSPNNVDLKDKMHADAGGRLEDDGHGIDDLSPNLSKNPVGDIALTLASLSKLDELKGINKLSASIATATAASQRLTDTMIPHHGLSCLPLEVLSLIRVWLHVLENNTLYTTSSVHSHLTHLVMPNTSFPLVCRRFREVELSTPELWTTVNMVMTLEQAKLQIMQSGDLPLRVHIHSNPDELGARRREKSCQCDLWRFIASHAQRCEGMRIIIDRHYPGEPFWHNDVRNCFNAFDGIHFRKLRGLVIEIEDEAVLSTLRTWSMPQLSELICATRFAALFALPISHPLDVLALFAYYDQLNADALIDLLSSPIGSNLRTLDLVPISVEFPHTQSTSRAVLSTLKSFRLQLILHNDPHARAHIRSLIQRIQAPAIERIAVEIDRENYPLIDCLVEWISSQVNSNLRNVDVRLKGMKWERGDGDIVYSKIVDAISLDNDPDDTPSNPPIVCVRTFHNGL